MDGKGSLTFANGDRFVGDFTNGEANGRGALTWRNGDSYTGYVAHGKPNGDGIQTLKNGVQIIGTFANGRATSDVDVLDPENRPITGVNKYKFAWITEY
jgi:hypothetical protein